MASEPASFKRIDPGGSLEWERPAIAERVTRPPAAEPPPAQPSEKRTNWRFVGIGSVVGLLAAVALCLGASAAFRAFLGHDDRATAAYAPPQSFAYIALNTDRSSPAWLEARDLAQTHGLDDTLAQIPRDLAAEFGISTAAWEQTLRPAIGEEIGFAVWPDPDAGTGEPRAAAIVMLADVDAAAAAIPQILEDDAPLPVSYRELTYYQSATHPERSAGIIAGTLIIASTGTALEDVIDAHLDGALAAQPAFTAAADRADEHPLVFAYLDSAALADTLRAEVSDMAPVAIGAQFDEYAAFGTITITATTSENTLRISARTSGRPAAFPTTTGSVDVAAFSALLPSNTVALLAGSDLYGTFKAPVSQSFGEAQELAGASGELTFSPDALTNALGIDLEGDLLAHLRGTYAVAIALPSSASNAGGSTHLLSVVADPAAIATTLDTLAGALEAQGAPIQRGDTGFSLDIMGIGAAATLEDNMLSVAISYGAAADTSGVLADNATYQRAAALLPRDAIFAGYVALQPLRDLTPAPLAEEQDFLGAADAVVFSVLPDGDGTRTELVVLLAGE